MKKLSKLLKALSGTVSWSLTSPLNMQFNADQPSAADPKETYSKDKQNDENERPDHRRR